MRRFTVLLAAGLVLLSGSVAAAAETLHLVIMSPVEPDGEKRKYEALGAYLRASNPLLGDVKLRIAKDFPEAVRLFKDGDVEGMFSGSFVAAVFVAKGVARSVARPLGVNGVSTYRTSIVAKNGTKQFAGIGDLKGKRVAYCPLASAGEVFLQSLLGEGQKPADVYTPLPVGSHQAALEAVLSGAADYAAVKSTVFVPGQYPGLALVGADAAEHPDNTFIMPPAVFDKLGSMISRVLLALESDRGEKAEAVRQAFGCKAFIATPASDFVPTFTLLKKARVDPKTFDFAF